MDDLEKLFGYKNDDFIERLRMERTEEWRTANENAPYLPSNLPFIIGCIAPYNGAFFRFTARHKENTKITVSVYYDVLDRMGAMDEPYWEIHPTEDNDCDRFLKGEEEKMCIRINELLEYHIKESKNNCD